MEPLLNDSIRKQLGDVFQQLEHPVSLILFTSLEDCEYCSQVQQLLEEMTPLSTLLDLRVYDLRTDADVAAHYRIDKAPALVIAAREGDQLTDFGIRYLGIPTGHEFSTLVQGIVLVSRRDSGLSQPTRQYLRELTKPVHMQVFVTPTCPYCPRAVLLAYQMAMENPKLVLAEGVEAMEFSELANKYHISGVPDTIINDDASRVVGAVPEANLLQEIRRALGD